ANRCCARWKSDAQITSVAFREVEIISRGSTSSLDGVERLKCVFTRSAGDCVGHWQPSMVPVDHDAAEFAAFQEIDIEKLISRRCRITPPCSLLTVIHCKRNRLTRLTG